MPSGGIPTALMGSDSLPFAALAEREGVSPSYFTRLVRLSYLAPDITHAILDGRQPRDLTAEKLLEHSRLPLALHAQENGHRFGRSLSEIKKHFHRYAAHITGAR